MISDLFWVQLPQNWRVYLDFTKSDQILIVDRAEVFAIRKYINICLCIVKLAVFHVNLYI